MLKHRFMHWLVAVLLIAAMFGQGTRVLAGTTGTLTGTVLDENGAPVTAAAVTVASPSMVARATTDATGKFTFLDLTPDTYVLSVEKQGYDPVSIAGVTVIADQSPSINVSQRHSLRQIARVTSRAASSLIKPGTVTDVYSITQAQQDKIQGVGGGGNLNSAWSAIATVPGVFVTPNLAGYIGAAPALSIRGGDYNQIGYEIDGVPINRGFDNYPSGPASSLGQQELQVYTGVPPANAEANGLSGFINQVIRTGTYPGFAQTDVGVGGPSYYHKASFEIGGSTPSRNFSYYLGIGGYNQDFRTVDQFNGAGVSQLYGAPLAFCEPTAVNPFYTPKNVPSCFTNGQYNGNTGINEFNAFTGALPYGFGAYQLGPVNSFTLGNVADRDNVVNLHFGLPHKDGTKDDIQLLGMINYIQNSFYDSTNDQGGAAYLGKTSLGVPFIIDGLQFNSPTGVALPSNYQGLTSVYQYPNIGQHADSVVGEGQGPVAIPAAQRGGFLNDQAIYKLQYTHTMGSNALLRFYGYSYYSDWLNTAPQSLYADYLGCCPEDYELSSHTRGVSASFIDQFNSQNLLNFTGSWTTSNTTRDNNTEMVNGAYGPNSVNTRTGLAVLVDSTNPTNGLCYTLTGQATTCAENAGPGAAQWATLGQAYNGAIAPIPTGLKCGSGPCEYYVVGNGLYATYNQVRPTFFASSLTDVFRPTNKLTINAGMRFDDFQYQTSDTSGTAARTLFYNAFNMDTCQDALHNLYDKVQFFGLSPTSPCPAGYSSIKVTNPIGAQTFTFPEWEPRLGFTYEIDPFTVLRASYGRYVQGPNSAFVQYNALQENAPALLYNTYSFQKFGFTTPDHSITPEASNNFDFSLEHQFKGDVSLKFTPFYRTTQGQIQQFYLNQQTSFVSGLNVGKQTSRGLEFELDKGDFDRQGFSARLTFTYTNSYINFTPLANGSSILTPINAAIANYNAYTSACASGGKLAGSSSCGTTITGVVASPCYTPTGAPAPSCPAGSVSNPYWDAPAQGLLNVNANYPTFDIMTQGIGSAVDAFGAPYLGSLVLNERVGRWSFAPVVQFFAGQRYGAPETTFGFGPDTCAGTLGSSITGDPRYPYGGAGGAPFDASTCTNVPRPGAGAQIMPIPDPYTHAFDGIGGFVAPTQLQLHFQTSFEASKNVTLVANLVNIVNTCFGGTKVKWAPPGTCTYGVLGGGSAGDVGNLYNPGAAIQPYINTPYEPGFAGFPFSIFVNAKIKI